MPLADTNAWHAAALGTGQFGESAVVNHLRLVPKLSVVNEASAAVGAMVRIVRVLELNSGRAFIVYSIPSNGHGFSR